MEEDMIFILLIVIVFFILLYRVKGIDGPDYTKDKERWNREWHSGNKDL